jgi:hypothetical protein
MIIGTSCSYRKLYPQDGTFYTGESRGYRLGIMLIREEVLLYISGEVDSAYYVFEIHRIIDAPALNYWTGQLVYQGHKNTDSFYDAMTVFEKDPEFGGVSISFVNEELDLGGIEMKLANYNRRNEIWKIYQEYNNLVSPENFGLMKWAAGWDE